MAHYLLPFREVRWEIFMELFYGMAISGVASMICIGLYCWIVDY